MEMQVATLRTQVEKSKSKAETMQQTLEDLQRQLTVKESELTEAGKFDYVVFSRFAGRLPNCIRHSIFCLI